VTPCHGPARTQNAGGCWCAGSQGRYAVAQFRPSGLDRQIGLGLGDRDVPWIGALYHQIEREPGEVDVGRFAR
jgi:hypothetical protein